MMPSSLDSKLMPIKTTSTCKKLSYFISISFSIGPILALFLASSLTNKFAPSSEEVHACHGCEPPARHLLDASDSQVDTTASTTSFCCSCPTLTPCTLLCGAQWLEPRD